MIQPEETNSSNSGEPETSPNETVPPYLKKQTSTTAGGRDDGRLPPRGGITAIATGGSGDRAPKSGQKLICKVTQKVDTGYLVHIPQYDEVGLLQTNSTYQTGQDVLTQYICRINNESICLLHDIHGSNSTIQHRQKKQLNEGDFVICQLVDKTENGYNVVLLDHKLDGFIEGSANYAPGVNVFAQFVGIQNNHLHCVFLKDSTASKTNE